MGCYTALGARGAVVECTLLCWVIGVTLLFFSPCLFGIISQNQKRYGRRSSTLEKVWRRLRTVVRGTMRRAMCDAWASQRGPRRPSSEARGHCRPADAVNSTVYRGGRAGWTKARAGPAGCGVVGWGARRGAAALPRASALWRACRCCLSRLLCKAFGNVAERLLEAVCTVGHALLVA